MCVKLCRVCINIRKIESILKVIAVSLLTEKWLVGLYLQIISTWIIIMNIGE